MESEVKRGVLFALLITLAVMIGCDYLPFGYTEISSIIANPAAFEGNELKVR